MDLQQTVSAERIRIGFFGMSNSGKSSLVNAITDQQISVVSDVKGTTTDPVKKAMELLPLGPVNIIDTPGLDDEGELGELRIQRTKKVLSSINIAVLVVDVTVGLTLRDKNLINNFNNHKIPFIVAYNKCDLIDEIKYIKCSDFITENATFKYIFVSAKEKIRIGDLKEMIVGIVPESFNQRRIISDLINKNDVIILVTPIDESAPKGRLILPQQLTIRDILDAHCTVIACQDTELEKTISLLKSKPRLIITDSKVFGYVSKIVPEDILLTSFSILFARYKGDLKILLRGAAVLSQLKDRDKVLISEGCTHHRQCNDIGTKKMPYWIEKFSGSKPDFRFTSGGDFPEDVTGYSLIVHCGGCMLTEKEMMHRIETAQQYNVPIVNYGIAIAQMNGILKRSIELFPDMRKLLD